MDFDDLKKELKKENLPKKVESNRSIISALSGGRKEDEEDKIGIGSENNLDFYEEKELQNLEKQLQQ
jgi:hypothetical protein